MFRKIVAFLHARAKAALIQPQSEREAVLTGLGLTAEEAEDTILKGFLA